MHTLDERWSLFVGHNMNSAKKITHHVFTILSGFTS